MPGRYAVTAPAIKRPDQPGTTTGATDKATASTSGADKAAAPTSSASAAGASVQAIIAAYRSLAAQGKAIASAITKAAPTPKRILLITSERELEGLAEYNLFREAVAFHINELARIRDVITRPKEEAGEVDSFATFLPAATSAVGDIISKVLVPLAPKFTFADTPLTIDNSALLTVVGGELVGHGFEVFTNVSLLLQQGTHTYGTFAADLARLNEALYSTSTAAHAAAANDTDLKAWLGAIEASLSGLRASITDDSDAAQRLLKGAAISKLLANCSIAHVKVSAAAALVHERGFLLWASRKHAGGVVVQFALYQANGAITTSGMFDGFMTYDT